MAGYAPGDQDNNLYPSARDKYISQTLHHDPVVKRGIETSEI